MTLGRLTKHAVMELYRTGVFPHLIVRANDSHKSTFTHINPRHGYAVPVHLYGGWITPTVLPPLEPLSRGDFVMLSQPFRGVIIERVRLFDDKQRALNFAYEMGEDAVIDLSDMSTMYV